MWNYFAKCFDYPFVPSRLYFIHFLIINSSLSQDLSIKHQKTNINNILYPSIHLFNLIFFTILYSFIKFQHTTFYLTILHSLLIHPYSYHPSSFPNTGIKLPEHDRNINCLLLTHATNNYYIGTWVRGRCESRATHVVILPRDIHTVLTHKT